MATQTEEIKQRLDIIDIVGEYIALKPSGSNHKARCPFHNEKSPSFMVSRDKQIYHCFGCSKGGDVFTFVQEMEGLDFPEALRLLAKKANVQLKAVDPALQTKRTKIFDANKAAMEFYHNILLKSQNVDKAREYFKDRGISDEMIEKFQLGYSSTSWDTLEQYLKQKKHEEGIVFEAGLTIKKDRGAGYIDRFRGRIMFPIHDANGNVVGFGGRIMEQAEGEKELAKYINSPQTVVYDKSRIIYGLWYAKQAIREQKEIIVVEGYMDVLACHKAGTENAVASSGTALTESHLDVLKRHSQKLLFSFDQDSAGAKAARRGIELALARSFEVLMITLPFGKDPDEVISKDPAAWKKAVKDAQPFMEYYFSKVEASHDFAKVEDKKAASKTLLPLISKLADPVERTHYVQRLASLVSVEPELLLEQLQKAKSTTEVTPEKDQPAPAKETEELSRENKVVQLIIALVRAYPNLVPQAIGQFDDKQLSDTPLSSLYKQIGLYYSENQRFAIEDFTSYLQTADSTLVELWGLMDLLAGKEFASIDAESAEKELVTLVKDLKLGVIRRQLVDISEEIKTQEQSGDEGTTEQLIGRFHQLTKELKDNS